MSRPQILVIAIALVLVIGMFFLPRVIINKDKKAEFSEAAKTGASEDSHEGHEHESVEPAPHKAASPAQLQALAALQKRYKLEKDGSIKVEIAKDMGAAYQAIGKFDSAGYYFETVANAQPSEENFKRSADQYFEAFSFASSEDRVKMLGDKVQAMYSKVLEKNPENLDAKTNLAMTYISSSNPMQGISLLREVIEKDPKNEKALYNLGYLSMQSRQFDKAVDRFKKVLEVNPKNVNANFYLGVALTETGQKAEAKQVFQKLKAMDTNAELQASVDEYLQKLQ